MANARVRKDVRIKDPGFDARLRPAEEDLRAMAAEKMRARTFHYHTGCAPTYSWYEIEHGDGDLV